jgi:hypothetical protein
MSFPNLSRIGFWSVTVSLASPIIASTKELY